MKINAKSTYRLFTIMVAALIILQFVYYGFIWKYQNALAVSIPTNTISKEGVNQLESILRTLRIVIHYSGLKEVMGFLFLISLPLLNRQDKHRAMMLMGLFVMPMTVPFFIDTASGPGVLQMYQLPIFLLVFGLLEKTKNANLRKRQYYGTAIAMITLAVVYYFAHFKLRADMNPAELSGFNDPLILERHRWTNVLLMSHILIWLVPLREWVCYHSLHENSTNRWLILCGLYGVGTLAAYFLLRIPVTTTIYFVGYLPFVITVYKLLIRGLKIQSE